MIQFAVAYVGTALAMLVLDIIWLTQMVNRLYQPRIGELLAEKPSMPPAVIFYLLYVTGIVVLAVLAGAARGRLEAPAGPRRRLRSRRLCHL